MAATLVINGGRTGGAGPELAYTRSRWLAIYVVLIAFSFIDTLYKVSAVGGILRSRQEGSTIFTQISDN